MTERRIEAPALRPTHPLGFLAALGLCRTLARVAGVDARLSWTGLTTPHAVLHTEAEESEVLSLLASAWTEQGERGAVHLLDVDGHSAAFPPGRPLASGDERSGKRGMNDPAKMTPPEFRSYAEAAERREDPEAAAWVRAVATDVLLDDDPPPVVASMTDLYLLSRRQRLAQQFEELWSWAQRNDPLDGLWEALHGWRRVPMQGGMNWDIDGNRNAAETPEGKTSTALVPGVTWLAMMSLPFFPVSAVNGTAVTRGVQRLRIGRRTERVLVMPAWEAPLDVEAIEVLLDHPSLHLEVGRDGLDVRLVATEGKLRALGVGLVHGSRVVARAVSSQREYYLGEAVPLPARREGDAQGA